FAPGMYPPVSRPLQAGVRFFRIPLPTRPSVSLAVHLPFPATFWVYPVSHRFPNGSDPSSSPAVDCPRWPSVSKTIPHRTPFGSSLSACLACQNSRRLSEVHVCWSSPLIPSSSPPSCWQIPPRLTTRRTDFSAATLSP